MGRAAWGLNPGPALPEAPGYIHGVLVEARSAPGASSAQAPAQVSTQPSIASEPRAAPSWGVDAYPVGSRARGVVSLGRAHVLGPGNLSWVHIRGDWFEPACAHAHGPFIVYRSTSWAHAPPRPGPRLSPDARGRQLPERAA